jgi:type I restriction enzyme M protein
MTPRSASAWTVRGSSPSPDMSRRHSQGKSPWSVLARVEEIVLATSGADAFELVFSLAAARLFARARRRTLDPRSETLRRDLSKLLSGARRAWPGLDASATLAVPDPVLVASLELLEAAVLDADGEGFDALFEQLVTRVGKGNKGQFFTPRHVVDFATRALALRDGERFVDPACGSGAFVARARAAANVTARGWDVDGRAVRVARLLAVATGSEPGDIERKDSLAADPPRLKFDAIATNPPFAGAPDGRGFELAALGGRVERDALFLERCLTLLRPGGRLAIVLPYGKVASRAWSPLRRWLVDRARVLAVVSLPRETFLPHTSQRAALLFLKKRSTDAHRDRDTRSTERVLLAISDRAGRDAGGTPIFVSTARGGPRTWREHDHDLGLLDHSLGEFLRAEAYREPW